ncbi:MAG: O-antigen ligase family protein, partial [Candidatus Omnitrophica bacterium]|nr:O-antigen ligase family protein [Candidatus Omnitrophota bacterium]MBU1923217.1 O-antigen ligase family protein [Candidatus Omnitrophota bacterium]
SGAFLISKLLKKEAVFINKTILLSFICLIIVSLFSFVNSVSCNSSIQGIVKLLKYLLIFVVCNEAVKDKKHIRRIVLSVCCGVILMAVDALWQFFFGHDFIHGIALHYNVGVARASAAFPNPNLLGIYMAAFIPLIAGLTILYSKGKNKLPMSFLSILALTGIFLTFSRGAGLAVYLAILFLCIAGKKKLLITCLVAILLIFPFVMPKDIKKWAKEVNYNPIVFMLNQDRISIYNNTINMITHHPFIGVGVNTFSKNYGKYKTESAEKYAHTPDNFYGHNIYLHMAGEIGLLGLGIFIWFLFLIFKNVTNIYFKLKDEYLRAVALSLIACLIAFLINGLTETSLYNARVAMVFWYLIGVALSLSRLATKPQIHS